MLISLYACFVRRIEFRQLFYFFIFFLFEGIVAFSVGLSHHATVTNHNKVVFDRIFFDLNSVYDRKSGEFTAPSGGVYEFNYHAQERWENLAGTVP